LNGWKYVARGMRSSGHGVGQLRELGAVAGQASAHMSKPTVLLLDPNDDSKRARRSGAASIINRSRRPLQAATADGVEPCLINRAHSWVQAVRSDRSKRPVSNPSTHENEPDENRTRRPIPKKPHHLLVAALF
jgi:hypothetical protein